MYIYLKIIVYIEIIRIKYVFYHYIQIYLHIVHICIAYIDRVSVLVKVTIYIINKICTIYGFIAGIIINK